MPGPTPKEQVLALHPQAYSAKEGEEVIIYTKSPGHHDDILGQGKTPAAAWKNALANCSLEEGTVEDDDKRIADETRLLKEHREQQAKDEVEAAIEEEMQGRENGEITVDEAATFGNHENTHQDLKSPKQLSPEAQKLLQGFADQMEKSLKNLRFAPKNVGSLPRRRRLSEHERRVAKRKASRQARKVNRQR